MKKIATAAMAASLSLVLLARAAVPSKAKVHGYSLSGIIASVDEPNKTLVVNNAAGKATILIWTNATSIFGGKLAPGQAVMLRYLDKGGKHIATSIRIGLPPSRRVTRGPTPTATPR